jgi:uncharacterized protein YqeY
VESQLSARLLEDLKAAMRESDTTRRDVLRFLRSEVHNLEIERGRPLSDQEIIEVIRRQIKQRREAIEQFARGGRQDLVAAEESQIHVLQQYLPSQMTYSEVLEIARDVVGELGAAGPKDMGKVMPMLRERIGARAEGSLVAKAAREALSAAPRSGG